MSQAVYGLAREDCRGFLLFAFKVCFQWEVSNKIQTTGRRSRRRRLFVIAIALLCSKASSFLTTEQAINLIVITFETLPINEVYFLDELRFRKN